MVAAAAVNGAAPQHAIRTKPSQQQLYVVVDNLVANGTHAGRLRGQDIVPVSPSSASAW
jgi:hypothetical protein